jgi:hypothetical protein
VVKLATGSYRQFRPDLGVPVRVTLGKPRFRLGYEYEEIRLWPRRLKCSRYATRNPSRRRTVSTSTRWACSG